jgi:hypothetical protein
MTLTIVTWLWKSPGYRSEYTPRHVNALYEQFQRRLKMPHRFICVTDQEVACETVPLWEGPLSHIQHRNRPNCYRRLRAFDPEIEALFGPHFVSVDIDAVVVADLDPLFLPLVNGDVDFKIWGAYTHPTTPYNGSMWGMRAGARRHVWDQFDPEKSPDEAARGNYFGSDQAIMSMLLGRHEAVWTSEDGVYGYRTDLRKTPNELPKNARIVFFHGGKKPWMPDILHSCPWISETGVTY